jgi:sigma-B regulation protein RsbU (phosphoserine phosphatase)
VTILIADNNRTTRDLLRIRLQSYGHGVVCAEDSERAIVLLKDHPCEIVMCNWDFLHGSSARLCESIRTGATYRYIIAYTSADTPLKFGTCENVDDILDEPTNAVQLQMRVLAAEKTLQLQKALADQAEAYRDLNEKLDMAYQTLHTELQAASELQLSLLPTVSDVHPKFCLDWLVLPSRYLAGDNLNYFMMQDRYLIFYHLDVAGHGVSSALLSVTLNQLLSPQPGSPMVRFDPKLELKRIVPPVDVVSELNRRFQPQGDAYFTIIYGVLDTETHEIRFCQAGHPSAIKIAANGVATEVGDGGFPVGLWPDMAYDETITCLQPGERLVLYSDGILACVNQNGEEYTLDRFKEVMKQSSELPIKKALEAVEADLFAWSEGRDFPDDISLLLIEAR